MTENSRTPSASRKNSSFLERLPFSAMFFLLTAVWIYFAAAPHMAPWWNIIAGLSLLINGFFTVRALVSKR